MAPVHRCVNHQEGKGNFSWTAADVLRVWFLSQRDLYCYVCCIFIQGWGWKFLFPIWEFFMEGYQPTNSIAFSAGSKEQFGHHQLTPPFFVHQVEKAQKSESPELLLLIFEQQMPSSAVSPLMCITVADEVNCSMASRQSIIYFQEKKQHFTDHNPQNARHFFSTLKKNKHCKPVFFFFSFHLYLPICNLLK